MAKKKVAHQSQDPKQQNPQDQKQNLTHHQQQQHSMDDQEEKLQNLKSLNAILVKDAKERKQQVESLVKAKEALETELTRSGKEKSELKTELAKMGDVSVSLEIEKVLFCVLIETQMGEMIDVVEGLVREKREKESEIGVLKSEMKGLMLSIENERERLSRVCRERDLLKSDVENWIKGANGLKERVIAMEEKERASEEEVGKLKKQYAILIKEKKEIEKEIKELKRLRDSVEDNLVEKVKEIDDLKREIEVVVRERNEIGSEKSGQEVKISELESGIEELNEIVASLRKEEGVLSKKVMELEKNCGEAIEKENSFAMEIEILMKENKEKERTIDRLIEEIKHDKALIDMADIDMKYKEGLIEKLLREKTEIEEVKVIKEGEIAELLKEVGELRDVVPSMKGSIKDQEDKNKQLASEVSHYRDAFEKARLERDDAQKSLDEEKKNSMNLRSKVVEMEKKVEETVEVFAKMKSEHENLIKERDDMESQVASLEKEKDLVQKNLMGAEGKIDDLRTKMESASFNSEKALTMLKDTVALVRQYDYGKEELIVTEKKLDGETEPYEAELEVIKAAFRNKETAMEEMKQQVELLQNSVAKAHKKNSFWTVVSSASTVVAAASIAYVARVR